MEDLTFVSETHGWALTDPNSCAPGCPTTVLTTTTGGAPWRPIAALPSAMVRSIRFANDQVGYAFDPDLFMTTDGGSSWERQPGPSVASLEIVGNGVVDVTFSQSGCPGPCNLDLQAAAVGSTQWHSILDLPDSVSASVQLVRQGPDSIYFMKYQNPAGGAPDEQGSLYVSHDAGVSWSQQPDPCGYTGTAENDTRSLATDETDVAVLCQPRTGGAAFVKYSLNGAATFTSTSPLPAPIGLVTLALTTSLDFFVSSGPYGGANNVLYAGSDAGRSWSLVATQKAPMAAGGLGWLGFESPSVGRWVTDNGEIWSTVDGGATWTTNGSS